MSPSSPDIAAEMHAFAAELYPICRSITGEGVRDTLRRIGRRIPLDLYEVPSGTPVYDWVVPKEWNIRDAYIKDANGQRVVDFRRSNLHVVNYSVPVRQQMRLAELKAHLHSLPDYPDWIPYRASYYKENWGFCLSHNQLQTLEDGVYDVCVDSRLEDGHLTYAECYLRGQLDHEVLVFTHICHPSLCNDNLSGIAVATYLARRLLAQPRRYSYRFVFAPTTIGSIVWLSRNEDKFVRIRHGLGVALVGDPGPITYKRSRAGNASIDRAMAYVLGQSGLPHRMQDFTPYGYDERQFCSPGINLPFGRFTRTPNACYPQYHTSADDLQFIRPHCLAESLDMCYAALALLDHDRRFINVSPKGEPRLGPRGLYSKTSAERDVGQRDLALLWMLNLSDGHNSLLDVAQRSALPFDAVRKAADELTAAQLLRAIEE